MVQSLLNMVYEVKRENKKIFFDAAQSTGGKFWKRSRAPASRKKSPKKVSLRYGALMLIMARDATRWE